MQAVARWVIPLAFCAALAGGHVPRREPRAVRRPEDEVRRRRSHPGGAESDGTPRSFVIAQHSPRTPALVAY